MNYLTQIGFHDRTIPKRRNGTQIRRQFQNQKMNHTAAIGLTTKIKGKNARLKFLV